MSDRPMVVLVHGVGLDRTMWKDFEAAFARPVHSYDMIGLGDGPRPQGPYSLGQYGDQLVDVVHDVGAGEPVDVVGFSMGALVAQRFAVDHADRLRRLVLVSPVFQRSAAERQAILDRVADVRAGGYAASIEPALERWFTAEFRARQPEAVDAVRRRMRDNDVEAYAWAYEVFATGDAELEPVAASITAPTLVVTGELDQRSTPDMAARLAGSVADGRCVIVPGVRHLLPIEAAGTLAGLVDDFLGA